MTLNILFICEGNAEVFLLYKILREEFKIEIEGQRKPALEGIATFLYYFE